jgi:hypothetical protein
MRKLAVLLLAAAALAALVAALTSRGGSPATAQASSHREAPLISEDPSADNTDTYAFRSPDAPDTVTIISNYIPGEDPAAGPNWYTFSPSARYVIYADKNGDGKPDITFQESRAGGLSAEHAAGVHRHAARREIVASRR